MASNRRRNRDQRYYRNPVVVRKLADREDFLMILCDYRPDCTKKNKCQRAHSEEELYSWMKELRKLVRDYSSEFNLKLCQYYEEPGTEVKSGKYCRGVKCRFAHSEEELQSWREVLGHVQPSQPHALLEMCRSQWDCKNKNCLYAHDTSELEKRREEHKSLYLESVDSSIPERCSYTVTCHNGVSCPYAHSEMERSELAKKLNEYDKTYPRRVPRADKLLPYALCENHKNKWKSVNGCCIYGVNCEQAHSQEELEAWEGARRREEQKLPSVRPFDLALSKTLPCPKLDCMGSCAAGMECHYAHGKTELEEWRKTEQCVMLGPLRDEEDPFLSSLMDYQRRFSDQLATNLSTVIRGAYEDPALKDSLEPFIDHSRVKIDLSTPEGQQCESLYDLHYLLECLKRNREIFADYLEMEEKELVGVASDLLEVRHSLAHSQYLQKRASSGGDGGNCHLAPAVAANNAVMEGEVEKTRKFIQRGISFMEHIIAKTRPSSGASLMSGGGGGGGGGVREDRDMTSLKSIEKDFRDFVTYQKESLRKATEYNSLQLASEKKAMACEVLKVMEKLLEQEEEPGQVTEFLATCLGARLKTTTKPERTLVLQ